MRNLYQEGKNKREIINYYKGKEEGYLLVDFIGDLVVRIIKSHLDSINVKDTLKVDDLRDITVNDEVKLYSLTSINNAHINFDKNDSYKPNHSFTIPGDLEKFKLYVEFLLKSYNLGTIENDTLSFNCDLATLLDFYSKESAFDKKELEEKAEFSLEHNNDIFADVHATCFENWFLDRVLINILSNTINSNITVENPNVSYEEMYFNKYVLIYKESFAKNNQAKIDKNFDMYVIKDEYYNLFLQLVNKFMRDYNLGGVVDFNGSSSIEFNTKVANVMDAYYMEKQRIEQFTTEPKVKTL